MAISKKAWTGFAKEATPGTAVTPPTRYLPAKTVFKGTKKREYLVEERGTRDENYGVVDSVRQSAVDIKGPYYPDTSPVELWGAIGLPVTTQPNATACPTVYLHTFPNPLADVPPSYTIARNLDARAYTVPYSVLEKFAIHFAADGKLLEMDSNWIGLYAQIYSSPPTPTYSTVLPLAGYLPTLKFVDNVQSLDISDLQIDYSQKITLWFSASNSPDFITAYFGSRAVHVSFTARFDNDTLYQRWRNNVPDLLNFDIQGPNIGKLFTVSLGSPSAGTFTLTYNGQTTAGIAYNAAASAVQTAVQGLSSVGTNATVSGSAGGPYTVSLLGPLLNDGNLLTGSGTGLTGGTFSISVPTYYPIELNIQVPNLSWDTMEHDTSKDNVLIKGKGTAFVPQGAALLTGFVQNNVTAYTT